MRRIEEGACQATPPGTPSPGTDPHDSLFYPRVPQAPPRPTGRAVCPPGPPRRPPMRHPWTACLRRLFRPARPVRRRPRFQPRLDVLEERCVPTAYTVTTTKDLLNDTTPGELTLR